MISDTLHYALISEFREAPFAERRRAACALLDVVRSEGFLDDADQVLASVEEKYGEGIVPEARALVAELGAC